MRNAKHNKNIPAFTGRDIFDLWKKSDLLKK